MSSSTAIKSGIRYGLFRSLAIPLRLLQASVLGRLLGVNGYGTFGYALSWMNLLGGPYMLVIQALVIRETARLQVRGRYRVIEIFLRSMRTINALLAGTLVVVCGVFLLWPGITGDRSLGLLIAWTCSQLALMIVFTFVNALLRAEKKPTPGLILDEILRPLLVIGSLLAIISFTEEEASPAQAMMCMAFSSGAVWFLGTMIYRKLSVIHKKVRLNLSSHVVGIGMRRTLPFAKLAVLNIAYLEIAVQGLGLIRDMDEVGIYRVAMQMAMPVTIGLQSARIVLQPHASEFQTAGSTIEFQRVLRFATRLGSLIAILLGIVLIVFGKTLIAWIFGNEYISAYAPLVILVIGQIISVSLGPCGMLLNMNRMESIVLRHLLIACCISIAIVITLVHTYGIIGAAYAVTLSLVYWRISLWWKVRTKLQVDSSIVGRIN